MIVNLFIIFSCVFLDKKDIYLRDIFKIVVIGILIYLILILAKCILKFGFPIQKNNFFELLGVHERNELNTLNFVIQNEFFCDENSYLVTIKNILPKFFTKSTNIKFSDILGRYILNNNNLGYNMGALYLTEAYSNFRILGIYLISIILSVYFYLLEKIRSNNKMYLCIYLIIVGEMSTLIYYGFQNYFKILVYTISFIIVIFKLFLVCDK
ncbi:hypothetical protein [Haloimpatiens massiliensis]|uniref:hypothetical protein n=1 Tax=Haloimpatiens massiliensis TaxID=1658110 RepID=UPI0011AEFC1C|nr:hypothetical protein [Haloimpatiens massiliensis]